MEYLEFGKKAPDFDGMKWVISAIAKAKVKQYKRTECVYINDKKIVGNDGCRLHILDSELEYPPGLYKVVVNRKDKIVLEKTTAELLDYAAWEKVVPISANYETIEVVYNEEISVAYTKIIRSLEDKYTLRYNYLYDALYGESSFTVHIYKGQELIVCEDNKKKAIIMLLRL